ncbi:MAG: M28 family peptidase [Chloroherpetonaceae bacterium]
MYIASRVLYSVLLLLVCACQSAPVPPAPATDSKSQSGYALITPALLKAHLSFIASDELEGRETAKRGQKIAARYIATEFEKFGLKPLGDSGTYFQKFRVKEQELGTKSTISVSISSPAKSKRGKAERIIETKVYEKFFEDFYGFGRNFRDAAKAVSGSVIFAGYGIDDEVNYKYSDYAGVSAKNKIVLVLGGEPQEQNPNSVFAGTTATKWSDARVKTRAAFEQKAAALLVVSDLNGVPIREQLKPELRDAMVMSTMSLADEKESLTASPLAQPKQSLPVFYISSEIANHILKPSGKTVSTLRSEIDRTGKPNSFNIPNATVSLNVDFSEKIVETENVCAMLEGSDDAMKQEAIVITAHYDHVGTGASGNIYNGADDDGSGTTAVLALAEAFAKNNIKPKRSLIFMTVSGEEKGLLGSDYYTQHPTFPLNNTIANLNIDMIGRMGGDYERSDNPNYIYVIGSDKISLDLDSVLKVQNALTENLLLDYKYNSDDDPNRFYYRSDHYNFAKHNIPVIFFFNGTHEDYHGIYDEVNKIHFEKMAKVTRLVFAIAWNLSNRVEPLKKKAL